MKSGSIVLTVAVLLVAPLTPAGEAKEGAVAALKAMLTDFHLAAAEADGDRYLGHIAPDAILLGTDRTERFTLEEYKKLVEPYMSQGTGWTTVAVEQNVYLSKNGKLAWFDERLEREGLGEMRATGVARLMKGEWRLVQMNMSFPVPNALVRKLMAMIRELPEQE